MQRARLCILLLFRMSVMRQEDGLARHTTPTAAKDPQPY